MSIFKPRTAIVPTPPKLAPWNFDLVVLPPCVATVTVEGLPGGPVRTNPDGYVYVQGLPGYLRDGMIMVTADGYKPLFQPSVWPELVAKNAAGGHNYLKPLIQEWPEAPDRMSVITARVGFQGVTVDTQQFGTIRAWGPELGSLNDVDADGYVRQLMASTDDLGRPFNAVEFAVSWNYQTQWLTVPGADRSQDLPELRRRVKRAIQVGAPLGLKAVFLFCAGDGLGAGPGYNDSFGWTYGREWLLANFARIHAAFGPQPDDPIDLRPWMVFLPAYDGADAYQWGNGANVVEVWHLMDRIVHGHGGYVGFEWPSGEIQLGDGFPTYTPENGGCVDVWLLEEPTGVYPPRDARPIQQITQQIGRAVRPYRRPTWAVDDPAPPLLIPPANKYGEPTVTQLYEHTTYDWGHGCSVDQVHNNRRVLREIAPGTILC